MTKQELKQDLARVNEVLGAILAFLPSNPAETKVVNLLKQAESNELILDLAVAWINHLSQQPPAPTVTETVISPVPDLR